MRPATAKLATENTARPRVKKSYCERARLTTVVWCASRTIFPPSFFRYEVARYILQKGKQIMWMPVENSIRLLATLCHWAGALYQDPDDDGL